MISAVAEFAKRVEAIQKDFANWKCFSDIVEGLNDVLGEMEKIEDAELMRWIKYPIRRCFDWGC